MELGDTHKQQLGSRFQSGLCLGLGLVLVLSGARKKKATKSLSVRTYTSMHADSFNGNYYSKNKTCSDMID